MLLKIRDKIKTFFEPDEQVMSIYDIDLHNLGLRGIKGVVLDLDDTILPKNEYRIPISLYSWIERLKDMGFKLFLASNGGRAARVKYISEVLKIEGNAFSFKPLPFIFFSIFSKMKLKPNEVVIIGDQLLTDVFGGNLAGMYTVLVKPSSKVLTVTRAVMKVLEDIVTKALNIKINF